MHTWSVSQAGEDTLPVESATGRCPHRPENNDASYVSPGSVAPDPGWTAGILKSIYNMQRYTPGRCQQVKLPV